MGLTYDVLDADLQAWISAQHLFFVGTAPSGSEGMVNVSPKGARDSFRVLGPQRVAYLDMLGSGIETVAHLRDNGRIVLMFCAFEGRPMVLRLHGRGEVVMVDDPRFLGLLAAFPVNEDVRSVLRSIIVVDVQRIGDSCGFVVPRMDFVEERTQLYRWAESQGRRAGADAGAGWEARYQQANNAVSLDGLPGLPGLQGAEDLSDAEQRRFSSVGRAL